MAPSYCVLGWITTCIRVQGIWRTSLRNCPTSLENMQIYHYVRFTKFLFHRHKTIAKDSYVGCECGIEIDMSLRWPSCQNCHVASNVPWCVLRLSPSDYKFICVGQRWMVWTTLNHLYIVKIHVYCNQLDDGDNLTQFASPAVSST